MNSNIYKEYFETLKSYLQILKIDQDKGLLGCSNEEIDSIKSNKENFPLAYEEYLRSFGRKFLFEFMDAEDMAFEDLGYINNFAKEVFIKNSLQLEKEYLVISERRNDYISLIYTDSDNPQVWIMSEYWSKSKGENLSKRTKSFTDLMTIFFRQTLQNHTATFHFVSSKIKDPEKFTKKQYLSWAEGLTEIKEKIDNNITQNTLVQQLNNYFLEYYLNNKSFFDTIIVESNPKKNKKQKDELTNFNNPDQSINTNKKLSLIEKILNIFK